MAGTITYLLGLRANGLTKAFICLSPHGKTQTNELGTPCILCFISL